MNGEAKKSYAEKINRVWDYISEHLNDDLSVERLSQVANFSKFHFHRQFTEYTGISVSRFILMARLKRASYQLAFHKDSRIIDIALDASFENPESFSRAFKNVFGQTPSQFRRKPEWIDWKRKYQFPVIERNEPMHVEIVQFDETKIAVLEHRGSPELLNDSVARFIEWRKQSQLSPVDTSNTYGLIYDDPKTTEPDQFRFDLCGSVRAAVPANPQGVINKTIPAGRCARLRHRGPYEEMDDKVRYLYGKWLPESGESLRDFNCFFHYINLFPEVAEHELMTDIYLPVE
ncbi:AraC family transcriptional regulator [Sedimenticola sp.]|uniref:AraC family transcriptional regulator n=1 Tax=Sedimenticola sp. TaxID=1940285 RepID=UPI003D0A7201